MVLLKLAAGLVDPIDGRLLTRAAVPTPRSDDAEVVFFGQDFEDARLKAEQMACDQGMYYVHPANEPLLIAGVGTYGLEIRVIGVQAEKAPSVYLSWKEQRVVDTASAP